MWEENFQCLYLLDSWDPGREGEPEGSGQKPDMLWWNWTTGSKGTREGGSYHRGQSQWLSTTGRAWGHGTRTGGEEGGCEHTTSAQLHVACNAGSGPGPRHWGELCGFPSQSPWIHRFQWECWLWQVTLIRLARQLVEQPGLELVSHTQCAFSIGHLHWSP